VTNWIGDDAQLVKLYTQIRRHNPEGDTLYIDGTVSKKYEKDGRKLVEFQLMGKNQDGELSVQGHAVAALPSKP
jgi:acyl dehydratase